MGLLTLRADPPPISPATAPVEEAVGCQISVQNPCHYAEVRTRRLRPWLEPLVAELAPAAESFVVRFVSDREQRRLNHEFRAKDSTTDVLSFAGGETAEGWHLGDVTVSIPTARRQAERAGHSVERELRLLILHGVLHCLGYDHETDDGAMERLERRLHRRWLPTAESTGSAESMKTAIKRQTPEPRLEPDHA